MSTPLTDAFAAIWSGADPGRALSALTDEHRKLERENAALKADRAMLDWAEKNLIHLYDGGGAYGIEFGPISTGTTKLEPFGTIREAIAAAMHKEPDIK